jgi:hypothetical protein
MLQLLSAVIRHFQLLVAEKGRKLVIDHILQLKDWWDFRIVQLVSVRSEEFFVGAEPY